MNVFLDTIGCRLNQAEIEKIASQLRQAGHRIVTSAAEADMVIVNTCAVTTEAASDSRQKIRQAVRAGAGQVVVTGCWATLEPAGAEKIPGVTRVIGNPLKDQLVKEIFNIEETFDLEPIARQPLPGAHLRTRAFIKVQDGCNNFCTFCITRLARGKSKSRAAADVIRDIQAAGAGGAKEIVLTGVNLGAWGRDFSQPTSLRYLVETILQETDIPRMRLSSLEPWDLDEDFFKLWQNPRLCRHLHLPLQSGSAAVLKRMVRKTTPQGFLSLVNMARQVSPQMAITTDIITGFPGETESEFDETRKLVEEIQFAGGHVFTYSSRPGTAAEKMTGEVPQAVKKQRSSILRAALAESGEHFRGQFVGKELEVLWEAGHQHGDHGWQLHGLTDNYIKVSAFSQTQRWNRFDPVRMERMIPDGLQGAIVGE